MNKDVMTADECALYLGVSLDRINHLVVEREIPYYKKGSRRFFKKSEINEWMTSKKMLTNEEIAAKAAQW